DRVVGDRHVELAGGVVDAGMGTGVRRRGRGLGDIDFGGIGAAPGLSGGRRTGGDLEVAVEVDDEVGGGIGVQLDLAPGPDLDDGLVGGVGLLHAQQGGGAGLG